MVPTGIGKDNHILFASALRSPYENLGHADDDIRAAARCIGIFGPFIRRWRSLQMRSWKIVCDKLLPLDDLLRATMVTDVKRVAEAKRPAVMAMTTIILRWPDLAQPALYVTGFPMVGELEECNVFKKITAKNDAAKEEAAAEFLGPSAVQWVDEIEQSQPRWAHVEEIHRQTQAEQEKGWCGAWMTRQQMDKYYGAGMWRPQKRFLIEQASGKLRVIDDALRSGHNKATKCFETIYTLANDFSVMAAQVLLQEILRAAYPGIDLTQDVGHLISLIPAWVDLQHLVQDMSDAYRQVPADPEQGALLHVAVWVPGQGWRYSQMFGNPFGMTSSVLNFNRLPTLLVSAARRIFSVIAGAYFDDNNAVDVGCANRSGEAALVTVFTDCGAFLNEAKAMPPASRRNFLGLDIDLGPAVSEGQCHVDLKEHMKTDIVAYVDTILKEGKCTSGKASKLRGLLGWSATGTYGKCGRVGQTALLKRQYEEDITYLTPALTQALQFAKELLTVVPRKSIQMLGLRPSPVIVYSDAWFQPYSEGPTEDGLRCRLGWVAFDKRTPQPYGGTMPIPDSILAEWIQRDQQVFVAEALAVLAASLVHVDRFKNQDIIWFVDNVGAMATLIKGSSGQADCANVCSAAHLLWAQHGTRVWFEWVASDDNPSDGLSRYGLLDEWTRARTPAWVTEEYEPPQWFGLRALPFQLLRKLSPKTKPN